MPARNHIDPAKRNLLYNTSAIILGIVYTNLLISKNLVILLNIDRGLEVHLIYIVLSLGLTFALLCGDKTMGTRYFNARKIVREKPTHKVEILYLE